MIHNVKRDQIRMVSGEVLVVDRLRPVATAEDMPTDLRELIGRMSPFLDSVEGGWFVAFSYDRIDSVFAGNPVAVVAQNIATVRELTVQIQAAEDAFTQ